MKLMTRNFENVPLNSEGYVSYGIATTKPQRYRDIPILYLFAPTFDMQIEFNRTKDSEKFMEKMSAVLKQRASAIEDWVKANANNNICLLCWEVSFESCHRKMAAEAIKSAGEKVGVSVSLEAG
ncbi:MAG: DUF488 family protein [Nitrospirae bacterium]|nr:DUF488 family protein [Nitrospirota bacterium]